MAPSSRALLFSHSIYRIFWLHVRQFEMKSQAAEELLKLGEEAKRAGDNRAARDFYLRLLELDQENEAAWYGLSEVVEDLEDRRICLENVLFLNPESTAARIKLTLLQNSQDKNEEKKFGQVIEREITPLTPAAAILYPERLEQRWQWSDELELPLAPDVKTSSRSMYNDVWETEQEICAFCATPLLETSNRCPGCRKKLSQYEFAYPKTSSNFVVYWVLVLAVAQLFMIQLLLDIILSEPASRIVWHGLLFVAFAALTVLLVIRHPAGYVGSILLLIIVLTGMIVELVTVSGIGQVVGQLGSDEYLRKLADSPYITLISPLLECIRPFQMITIVLALIYGIFFVGTDFEKTRIHLRARIDRGIQSGTEFYTAGKRYGEMGMWASAVLHLQRAVAREPNRAYYQMSLGIAYAKLGFFERASDVLESARQLSTNPDLTKEIETEIKQVELQKNKG